MSENKLKELTARLVEIGDEPIYVADYIFPRVGKITVKPIMHTNVTTIKIYNGNDEC